VADACGKPWDIELTLAGDKAEGQMIRDGVLYDLVGWLDSRAQRLEVRGGKSRSASHRPGPRILEFALGEEAGGWRGSFYAAAAGSRQCLTEVHLTAR